MQQFNVFDEPLYECCSDPLTGFFRDGFCNTNERDHGLHIVCCLIDSNFLDFSLSMGNDLSTPRHEFNFPGLKEGDDWCLCAPRWVEAYEANCAPKIYLTKTHEKTLELVPLKILREYNVRKLIIKILGL